MDTSPSEKTIRLSPIWILIGALGITMLGMVGGIIGERLAGTAILPSVKELKPLVTNVQQVTISSNSAATVAVKNAERSVVLLAQTNGSDTKILATGLIITNDGLIVTTSRDAQINAVIDAAGRSTIIDKVGADSVYGLQYFRLPNGIFSPLALTDTKAEIATQFLTVSRSPHSYQTIARPFFVSEYIVPTDAAAGSTQVIQGTSYADNNVLMGSPLLTEDGKVAGLLLNPGAGQVVTSSDLRRSLDRVANQKREADPLALLGLTINYAYTDNLADRTRTFTVIVQSVKPGSVTAVSGLKAGDSIRKIGETTVTVDTNIIDLLLQPLPLPITVGRAAQELILSFTPTP